MGTRRLRGGGAWRVPRDEATNSSRRPRTRSRSFGLRRSMAAVHKGTAFLRRLEIAAAWTGATLAFCAAGLALLGPHLGGPAPGLEGLPGFLVEMATATWIHTGALSAVVAVLLLWRRQRWPAAVLGVVALTALLPRWWPHHAPSLIPQKRTLRVAAV